MLATIRIESRPSPAATVKPLLIIVGLLFASSHPVAPVSSMALQWARGIRFLSSAAQCFVPF